MSDALSRCHVVFYYIVTVVMVMVVKHKCNKILMTRLAFLLCVSLTPVTGRASVKGMPRAPHTEGAEWSLNHVFWGQLYTLYTYNLFCNWSVVLKLVLVKHKIADPGDTKKTGFVRVYKITRGFLSGVQNHRRISVRIPSEFRYPARPTYFNKYNIVLPISKKMFYRINALHWARTRTRLVMCGERSSTCIIGYLHIIINWMPRHRTDLSD